MAGVLGQFGAIDAMLAEDGAQLAFAMNAGMYHADRAPVGLYIENGTEIAPLVASAGPGNFGLLPNGVFCIRETRADVIETLDFAADPPACTFATQSGPMLVIDGKLHPRFLVDSDSRHVRNGVGTSVDGQPRGLRDLARPGHLPRVRAALSRRAEAAERALSRRQHLAPLRPRARAP